MREPEGGPEQQGDCGAAVGVYIRTYNWQMWRARKAACVTQLDLVQRTGISISKLQGIESLRRVPTHDEMQDIADALDTDAHLLFPPDLIERVRNNIGAPASFRMAVPIEVLRLSDVKPGLLLSGHPGDESWDLVGLDAALDAALKSLSHRESRVLQARFGFGGQPTQTAEDVGRELGVTRERIRQIEAKALHKLRHPSRVKHLWPFSQAAMDDPKGFPKGRCQRCGGQMVRTPKNSEWYYIACFACGWREGDEI